MKCMRQQKGSTLIEVLITMVILAITAIGGIALYTNSSEIKTMAVHKKMAAEIANSKLENLRDVDFDDLDLEAGSENVSLGGLEANVSDGNGMSVTVTDVGIYKQIQVDIDWDETGQINRDFNVRLLTFAGP